ncbi:MAG TPA: FRG domain-containing protein [Chryseolinea sp.]|nr:FRG domain-containing protein [Chryseolinea sp.]
MRSIEGSIFSHLDLAGKPEEDGNKDVASTEPLLVDTFIGLLENVAVLSFHNKDHLLFFRGQKREHPNQRGNSSFYPSIYRTEGKEKLKPEVLKTRFRLLDQASSLLIKSFEENSINDSIGELKRRRLIQWSILQHYEVCDTPLLDVTQSLRVACSFALQKADEFGYVYVFGFPYMTNRISTNSEQEIVHVRLINICPPQALRPYFQEASLVGTEEVTTDYDDRSDLDFKRRLIAKFRIPNSQAFWGSQGSFQEYLFPENDMIFSICGEIKAKLEEKNNIEAMFPGRWLNEYQFKDGRKNTEILEIRNGNEYHALNRHLFNLDSVSIDKELGTIEFRKVGVGDDRKAFNWLKIVDENTYEGTETPGTTTVKYTRMD